MKTLVFFALAIAALSGCQHDQPVAYEPDPAIEIHQAMANIQTERSLREMIALVSPYEIKVTERLLADERVASVFVVYYSAFDFRFFTPWGTTGGTTHFNLAVLLTVTTEMSQAEVADLIGESLLAENLYPLSDAWKYDLYNDGVNWSTDSWVGIDVTIGPPKPPRILDETSYSHLGSE